MYILGLVGSMRGKKSREYHVISKYTELYDNADVEILTPDTLNIKYCRGCTSCFRTGKCPLDQEDDVAIIKEKLLRADLILVSSPVYVHGVSGVMKAIIDRIGYWTHTFSLIGKRIIIVTSTASNGTEYAMSYLDKIFSLLGGMVMGNIEVEDTTNIDDLEESMLSIKEKIEKSYVNTNLLKANVLQHVFYKQFRKIYLSEDGYEHDYWDTNHMLEFNTFDKYLQYKLAKE